MRALRLILTLGVAIWLGLAFQAASARQEPPPATATSAAATEPAPLAVTPAPSGVALLSPQPGQALQGSIAVVANTAVEGLQAAELEFAYAHNPTNTWFLIQQSNQPVANEALVEWDTSKISDGVYTLRLTVTLQDGSQQSVQVAGLRVRNYTPIETDTPTLPPPSATPLPRATSRPTATPTPLPPTSTPVPPTATAVPPNPAQLDRSAVLIGMGKGAMAVIGLFALGGLYVALRGWGKQGQE